MTGFPPPAEPNSLKCSVPYSCPRPAPLPPTADLLRLPVPLRRVRVRHHHLQDQQVGLHETKAKSWRASKLSHRPSVERNKTLSISQHVHVVRFLLLNWYCSILLELGREGSDLSHRMEGFQILINSCRSLSHPAASHS